MDLSTSISRPTRRETRLPPRGGSGFKLDDLDLAIVQPGLPPRGGSGFKLFEHVFQAVENVSLREEGVDLSRSSG